MSTFLSNMRRFSRSSSLRKNQQQSPQSPTSYSNPNQNFGTAPNTPGGVPRDQALGGDYTVLPSGAATNEGRPISSATDGSFDFPSRPVSGAVGTGGGAGTTTMSSQIPQSRGSGVLPGNLSRTDQIVLKHFWETKYQENSKRDLHYLKFPAFPQYPAHRDLLPYCEIYHLVKTSPGATIISLGSANGVYIGFELQTGSQLHIDLDDDWFSTNPSASITHHRVHFRPLNSMLNDPSSAATFKTWPKPLTIEFLEDQYTAWCRDLMSPCWESQGIRELASGNAGGDAGGVAPVEQHGHGGSVAGGDGSVTGAAGHEHAGSAEDDGYESEGSHGDGHGHGNGRVI